MKPKPTPQELFDFIKHVTDLETWNQKTFRGIDTSLEKPCGTCCCIAGHIVNNYGSTDQKKAIHTNTRSTYRTALDIIQGVIPKLSESKIYPLFSDNTKEMIYDKLNKINIDLKLDL